MVSNPGKRRNPGDWASDNTKFACPMGKLGMPSNAKGCPKGAFATLKGDVTVK